MVYIIKTYQKQLWCFKYNNFLGNSFLSAIKNYHTRGLVRVVWNAIQLCTSGALIKLLHLLFYHYFFASTKKVTKKSSLTKLFLISTFFSLYNLNSHEPFIFKSCFRFIVNFYFHKKISFSSNSRLFYVQKTWNLRKTFVWQGNDRRLLAFFFLFYHTMQLCGNGGGIDEVKEITKKCHYFD